MATDTPSPRRAMRSSAFAGGFAGFALRLFLLLLIVGAISVMAARRYPLTFLGFAEYMPRTPVAKIPDGPQHDEEFFKYGSIGNEANEGIPYKVWAVMPRVCPQLLTGKVAKDKPARAYGEFGFLFEDGKDSPIGMSRVRLGVGNAGLEQIAINCAVCHVQTFRGAGQAQPTQFVGGVANQLRSQAYFQFISDCTATENFANKTLKAMRDVFGMSWPERQLYNWVIIPMTLAGVDERIRKRFAWTWRRTAWGPGRVDPFNPPKFTYLKQPIDDTVGNSDMMPIWNAAQKETIQIGSQARPELYWHWDGLSTDLREVVLNSALGDGMTAEGYRAADIDRILRYLRALRSPKAVETAGLVVDEQLRQQGERIFEARCAECHGWQGRRFMTIVPAAEIGTDVNRLDMWTDSANNAYNDYDSKGRWDFSHFRKNQGYLAQPLEGIWLTGPYLHNGSVPTLDDLLRPARERPEAFLRGSDKLDLVKGGYDSPVCRPGAYDETYRISAFCYDTQLRANSNKGHDGPDYGTDLSAGQRRALVHYLLTL